MHQQILESGVLQRCKVFRSAKVTDAGFKYMADHMTLTSYREGDVVFAEGAEGGSMFVVSDGKVGVLKHGRQVATLGQGRTFGEVSLLNGHEDGPSVGGGRRTATITACTDSVALLELPREAYLHVLSQHARASAMRSANNAAEALLLNDRVRKLNSSAPGGAEGGGDGAAGSGGRRRRRGSRRRSRRGAAGGGKDNNVKRRGTLRKIPDLSGGGGEGRPPPSAVVVDEDGVRRLTSSLSVAQAVEMKVWARRARRRLQGSDR